MKKMKSISLHVFFAVLLLGSSVLMVSCTKSNLTELSAPATASKSAINPEAAAHTYQNQQTWAVDDVVFVPCANNGQGENVHVTGYVHITYHMTVNGNHFSLVSHTNFNEVSGTGMSTGDRYVPSGGGQLIYNGVFENGQSVATGSTRVRYTGAGPGNNLTVNYSGHVTVNANGQVSTILLQTSQQCD